MEQFQTSKDLARTLQVSVRTIHRLARRLDVPPTVDSYACQRWSQTDADELVRRWQAHCSNKHHERT